MERRGNNSESVLRKESSFMWGRGWLDSIAFGVVLKALGDKIGEEEDLWDSRSAG